MLLFGAGSSSTVLSQREIRDALDSTFNRLGPRKRVLAIPPDFTRCHSQAGILTEMVWECYGERLTDILPAIGTHLPMTDRELAMMFGRTPKSLFRVHDWRNGLSTLGETPSSFVREVSEGKVDYGIPMQVDPLLVEGGYDLILSLGQVVPHEVVGMAGYNKNLFVGTGGAEGISKTHFLGAVHGMERMMGRVDTPVRRVLNYGSDHFARELPIVYVLTVVGRDDRGAPAMRGLYIGDDVECFERAAALSLQVNFELLDRPIKKAVVYLDPLEFKSTWLGNKSIYRTRMALADDGELIVLAPGVERFGEDETIDRLIRECGYVGAIRVLELVRTREDLKNNLSAAAHLIHGSSEGRFSITYCPGALSKREIEHVNFRYRDLREMMARYQPEKLRDGMNTMDDGEEIFFISNPALGLWAHRERFEGTRPATGTRIRSTGADA